jgi:hypothetical protein
MIKLSGRKEGKGGAGKRGAGKGGEPVGSLSQRRAKIQKIIKLTTTGVMRFGLHFLRARASGGIQSAERLFILLTEGFHFLPGFKEFGICDEVSRCCDLIRWDWL